MNHLLRRPRPKRTTAPTNFDTECAHCRHGWRGMSCRCAGCPCPTSWMEPA